MGDYSDISHELGEDETWDDYYAALFERNRWSFVKTNSKGKPKFKYDTGENWEDAMRFFESVGAHDMRYKEGGSCLFLSFQIIGLNGEERTEDYQYYPTTGRWGTIRLGRLPRKHYCSKGAKDFFDKYVKKQLWLPTGDLCDEGSM